MDKNLVIAIDGPAGAGKSTTAKELALQLNYTYIDTGAMYRAITLLALQNNISMADAKHLTKLAEEAEIEFAPLTREGSTVFLNGEDVTKAIRSTPVNDHVSLVATVAGVRQALVQKQRLMAKSGGVVMDGRDIGTVVLPNADIKIFLTATLEARTQRRLDEMQEKGLLTDYSKIKDNLTTRDHIDSQREVAPLCKAEDAIEIDSTLYTLDQVVTKIMHLAQEVCHE